MKHLVKVVYLLIHVQCITGKVGTTSEHYACTQTLSRTHIWFLPSTEITRTNAIYLLYSCVFSLFEHEQVPYLSLPHVKIVGNAKTMAVPCKIIPLVNIYFSDMVGNNLQINTQSNICISMIRRLSMRI